MLSFGIHSEETDEGTYIFNAKDLCMIDHLQELLDAGVDSLKIEGRNKSAYYVAIITNAYRAALDAAMAGQPAPEWALREVASLHPYSSFVANFEVFGKMYGEKDALHEINKELFLKKMKEWGVEVEGLPKEEC